MKTGIALIVMVLVIGGGALAFRAPHASSSSAAPDSATQAAPAATDSTEPMIRIAGGEFKMGDAGGREDEIPHTVSVGPFLMDRFLVTQELYESVMGINPSKRKGKKNPVEQVRWNDAVRFCNKCSQREGLTPCYDLKTWTCDFSANGYRLPTEAEWEFACRAGGSGKYCFGDDAAQLAEYAWFNPGSRGMPHPVGEKKPNAFGLFDMHGNVWQWCNDAYGAGYYKESPRENPTGPASGDKKVLRGGAWDMAPEKCRAAYRLSEFPMFPDACFGADSYGVRRVRSVTASVKAVASAKADVSAVEKTSAAKAEPSVKAAPASAQPAAAGKIDVAKLKGTIVFVSDRGGALDIWKMSANGKNATQLTKDPFPDANPRFSHDGKRILYTSLRDGFPEIWMMNRDGSSPHFVTKGSQSDWSPDDAKIVFIRENQAFVRDLGKNDERRATPEGWERCGVPAWSPDGTHFAVASRHLESIGIFLVDGEGKTAQIKTEEASCTPRWSKDGSRLLCQTVKGHIHQVQADGKNWEQVTFGPGLQHEAVYSPDGKVIAYCRAPDAEGPWQIFVQNIDGDDDFVPLTTEGSNMLPDWSAVEE
jgi:formylglycine-generating enzyme required for sulfatase activity